MQYTLRIKVFGRFRDGSIFAKTVVPPGCLRRTSCLRQTAWRQVIYFGVTLRFERLQAASSWLSVYPWTTTIHLNIPKKNIWTNLCEYRRCVWLLLQNVTPLPRRNPLSISPPENSRATIEIILTFATTCSLPHRSNRHWSPQWQCVRCFHQSCEVWIRRWCHRHILLLVRAHQIVLVIALAPRLSYFTSVVLERRKTQLSSLWIRYNIAFCNE